MTSRSSFFDLIKENLKRRLWTIALSVVVFLFYFPVAALMNIDLCLNSGTIYDPMPGIDSHLRPYLNIFSQFKGFHNAFDGGTVTAVIIFFAVMLAVSAFTYLHDRKMTDFYHSIPVSRRKLFAAANINSILIIAVPYLVMSLISAVITGMYTGVLELPGVDTGVTGCVAYAFKNYLAGMCVFLLIYSVTVLAMMMTAHRAVAVLALMVFFFYLPAAAAIISSCMEVFFHNLYMDYERLQVLYQCLSPLYWVCMDGIGGPVRILVSLAGGVLLLAVSGVLYDKRSSECAGKAMAFEITKAPIRMLIVIPVSLAAGITTYSMMNKSVVWAVFGMAAAAVLSHALIEIIYSFDFRKLFGHKLQMGLSFAAAACVFSFFWLDLSGFDSRIPDDSRVESAGVFTYYMDDVFQDEKHIRMDEEGFRTNYYSYAYCDRNDMDVLKEMHLTGEMLEAVRRIAEDGIFNAQNGGDTLPGRGINYSGQDEYENDLRNVIVAWHLKNGRSMYRSYTVDIKKLRAELDSIYDTKEYKYAVYPVTALDKASPERDFTGVNYQDCMGKEHLAIAEEDIDRLYETYCRELLELRAEDRRDIPVVCNLQFKSRSFQQMADDFYARNKYLGVFSDMAYYPVYESFDETLKLIAECGADINAKIAPENINALIISNSMYDEYETAEIFIDTAVSMTSRQEIEDMIITDTELIREMLDAAQFCGFNAGNNLYPYFYGVNITAYIKDRSKPAASTEAEWEYAKLMAEQSGMSSVMLYFRTDNIPESVKEHFMITDADLKKYGTVY